MEDIVFNYDYHRPFRWEMRVERAAALKFLAERIPAPEFIFDVVYRTQASLTGWDDSALELPNDGYFELQHPEYTVAIDGSEDGGGFFALECHGLEGWAAVETVFLELLHVLKHCHIGRAHTVKALRADPRKLHPGIHFGNPNSRFWGFDWINYMCKVELDRNGGDALLQVPGLAEVRREMEGGYFRLCEDYRQILDPNIVARSQTAVRYWAELNGRFA
ncbi:MAG: hypothetical protein AAGN35_07095 [Bacteroidota bacterium]